MFTGTVTVIPAIRVMYFAGDRARPVSEQAPDAFRKLEECLPSIRGHRFFGVVVNGEYRACVAVRPGGSTDDLQLPEYTIPAGRYFCRRLKGWLDDTSVIGRLVDQLLTRSDHDPSRPVVEYYRSHRELVVRVPVK